MLLIESLSSFFLIGHHISPIYNIHGLCIDIFVYIVLLYFGMILISEVVDAPVIMGIFLAFYLPKSLNRALEYKKQKGGPRQ